MEMIRLFSSHIPAHAGWKVYQLIRSGWINRGQKAEEFEKLFCEMFGYRHALSVNSCTSALRLAYTIAGTLGPKGKGVNEIITTPWTMVATNTAILEAGFKPVFADVKYTTANIDPYDIERKITDKTKAITIVHYAGYPCDMDLIKRIAGEHGLPVIQDAAHALGAKYFNSPIGKFSDFVCFSFQAIKHVTTGDGGMFVTYSNVIYDEAKERGWFGIDKAKRIKDILGTYPKDITRLGFKYVMNDINATIGICSLMEFKRVFKKRVKIAKRYQEELDGLDNIELMSHSQSKESAHWLFPMHVKRRLKFAKEMRKRKIEVAVHNWRNDQYSIFGELKNLPNTKRLNKDLIHIPLHAELTQKEVDYVIETIKRLKWK